MNLYMKCTTDQLELPLAVENSPAKLANRFGLTTHSVSTMCSKGVGGWHRVEYDPECWPDNDGNLWTYDQYGRAIIVEE